MTTEEALLIKEAHERGFNNAIAIKPGHMIEHDNCPIIVIPKDVELYVNSMGDLVFQKKGTNISSFSEEGKEYKWAGIIYYKKRGSWAEIVSHRVGDTVWKSKTIGELSVFPSEGVCWQPTKELRDFLLARDKSSTTACGFHVKGIAWNYNSCWEVATYSGKTEYNIKQLEPFFMKGYKAGETTIHVGQNPMTPEECYIPEKWCIVGTQENKKLINEFMHSHSEAWKSYSPSWENYGLGSIFHYPPVANSTGHSLTRIEQGYTEITTEQFKRHILKEEYVPFSVRNDYRLPDKWYIMTTEENQTLLKAFLDSKKNEYDGYKDTWEPYIGNCLLYPQHSKRSYGIHGRPTEPGYIEITFEQFRKHFITHTDKQIINNLNLQEDGKSRESRENTKGESCKVQRPHLSVRGGSEIRADSIRCSKVKIQVGNGYSPDSL